MELKRKIIKEWKHLIFRRVQSVIPVGDPISILRKKNEEEFKEISQREYDELSSDIKERECCLKYQTFSGLTSSKPLLVKQSCCINNCCNDYDHTISFHSENYCELDISNETSSFYFDTNIPICKIVDTIPRSFRVITKQIRLKEPTGTADEIEEGKSLIEKGKTLYREAKSILQKRDAETIIGKLFPDKESITSEMTSEAESLMKTAAENFKKGKDLLKKEWTIKPKPLELSGDLVCGVLNPRNRNKFQFWFIASEQFYRCFQLVMHENHPLNEKKTILSGSNKLCTNTFKKKAMEKALVREMIEKQKAISSRTSSWVEIMEIDGQISKLTEKLEELEQQEYWSLRSEKISRQYCHIYPAIALICLYNEKLTQKNVPGCLAKWDVPNWMLN